MKGVIIKTKAFIKQKLGLCNTNGCCEKAIGEIRIDCIKVKRSLCQKHLELYKKLTEKEYSVGIDLAKEEDKTAYIKVYRKIDNKSKQEKQLESLYKLLNKVKKNRVKKKIRNRINKVKRKVESNKNRS